MGESGRDRVEESVSRRRRPASGRVSMAMVAARAGVSGQTVSRVVNGSSRVDPDTRARVEQAMTALGYRPHRAARALRPRCRSLAVDASSGVEASAPNGSPLKGIKDAAKMKQFIAAVRAADVPL